ncbi:MAG: TlpA family protein disulfide reductase [Gemmataceae bacterium]|nr:TlpA family protein disulfide reductase [Gemmataceae bacterium]
MGKPMRSFWPVLLLLGTGCAARWPEGWFAPVSQKAAAPEPAGPLDLAEHRGKVALLSFWFSACPPCRAMFPHEKRLVERFQSAPFVLVGVNADDDPAQMQAMEAKAGLTWRSRWDGKKGPLAARWQVGGYPTFVLLDKEGRERWRHVGPPPPGLLESTIAGLLAQP